MCVYIIKQWYASRIFPGVSLKLYNSTEVLFCIDKWLYED